MPNSANPRVRLVCQCGSFHGKGTLAEVMAHFERHILEHHSFEEDAKEEAEGSEEPKGDG